MTGNLIVKRSFLPFLNCALININYLNRDSSEVCFTIFFPCSLSSIHHKTRLLIRRTDILWRQICIKIKFIRAATLDDCDFCDVDIHWLKLAVFATGISGWFNILWISEKSIRISFISKEKQGGRKHDWNPARNKKMRQKRLIKKITNGETAQRRTGQASGKGNKK